MTLEGPFFFWNVRTVRFYLRLKTTAKCEIGQILPVYQSKTTYFLRYVQCLVQENGELFRSIYF